MEQLNRIELRGTVGSTRITNIGGKNVLNCTLATNYAYTGKNGEAVIDTTWHNIVAWESDRIADVTNITKGTRLYVCGRLRSQKYTGADEVERTIYEVLASRLVPIDGVETFSCEMYN